jgi:hypothetical protein
MKSTCFTICLLVSIAVAGYGQQLEIEWEKQFNLKIPYLFSDVVENADGTFTVLGSVDKKANNEPEIWLLKFSAAGDTLWTGTYPNEGKDMPGRLSLMPDGSYLILALNTSVEEEYAWVVCASPEGKEKWRRTSSLPRVMSRTDITVSGDGTWWWMLPHEQNGIRSGILLLHLDNRGEILAEYNYTGDNEMTGHAMKILPDGTLAMTGQLELRNGASTLWAKRIQPNGKVLWDSAMPASGKTVRPECICCTPDNHLLIAGWIGTCMNPDAAVEDQIFDFDLVISKLDSTGKILWTKNYDREGSEGGNSLAVMPDGNILVAGRCETSFTGTVGPWLIITDKTGKLLTDKVDRFRFGGDQASRIISTADGGFLMVGPGLMDPQITRYSGWIKKYHPLQ